MTIRILLAVLALLSILAVPTLADDADLAGHWAGTIELPGQELAVDLDFAFTDGAWSGDITIPAQGARDLPLTGITVAGGEAVFAIRDVPGDPVFAGMFGEDGATLAGDFTQGGQSFPFTLSRSVDPAAEASASLESLGETIAAALADWHTPGLCVGIVKDGRVVLAEGYGLRDVEKELPVTAHTLFAIGSSSKAFTTLAMGQLVDEGKLDWDRPVKEFLPGFALYDEYASDHIAPRDLVTHRSGLPRHDLVWYGNVRPERADLVARLPHLEPNRELRETWQYNNLMYMTAGYLVGQLRGTTWEEAVREHVFEPLGMSRSNFSVDVSQKDADHARPYLLDDDEVREVAFRNLDTIGPAGSINSCASDMVQWLLANLGHGGDIISDETLQELHTPQMAMSRMPREDHLTPMSYAMGWFTDTWRGHYRVQHGGNIDGFTSAVWLFPRAGIGITVQSNRSGDALPGLIAATAADLLLGLEPMDHLGEAATRRDQAEEVEAESEENKERFRRDDSKPSRDADEYAGRYEHPGYGVIEVTADGRDLTVLYNGMTMPLRHWHYDVYSVEESDGAVIPEDLKINFLGDGAGRISRLEAGLEVMVDPIVFTRLPDDKLSDPDYLARLVGEYEIPPQTVTIALQGERLVAVVPGQPAYTLEPMGDDEFALGGLNGFSLRFTVGDEGPATEAVFIQPNGVFTAKRIVEQE
jgi:CubicO group peptidase (beta-lactamase class C family)